MTKYFFKFFSFIVVVLSIYSFTNYSPVKQNEKNSRTIYRDSSNKNNTTKNLSYSLQTSLRTLNPIIPAGVYIADPEARQMPDGRIYIYGSRDEPGTPWCSKSYDILSSSDLVNWSVDQNSFSTSGIGKQTNYTDAILYAPDCIYKNGNYYLYYCLAGGGDDEGVAVSNSPYGPFINGKKIEGIKGIDPSVFIDDDGQAYLYWGQGSAKAAKLSKNMLSIEGEIHSGLLTYDKDFFNEASSVRKINGKYYYIYAGHQRHGKSNCATLNYAIGSTPFGPFTYKGVIIDNWKSGKNLENNHGSIIEINNKWYVFYHRPTHGTSSMRKVCVEPIQFRKDGTIAEAEMTTQGISGPMDPLQKMDAARACIMDGNVIVNLRRPADDLPEEYLSDIKNGDYAVWKYFDFTGKKVNSFTCKTWNKNLDAKIEIRLDSTKGQLVGTCNIEPMKEETAYTIHQTSIKNFTGKHAIVFIFKAMDTANNDKELMNLDWFIFGNKSKAENL